MGDQSMLSAKVLAVAKELRHGEEATISGGTRSPDIGGLLGGVSLGGSVGGGPPISSRTPAFPMSGTLESSRGGSRTSPPRSPRLDHFGTSPRLGRTADISSWDGFADRLQGADTLRLASSVQSFQREPSPRPAAATLNAEAAAKSAAVSHSEAAAQLRTQLEAVRAETARRAQAVVAEVRA